MAEPQALDLLDHAAEFTRRVNPLQDDAGPRLGHPRSSLK